MNKNSHKSCKSHNLHKSKLHKSLFSTFLLLTLCTFSISAANSIKGVVKDAKTNEPLIGVTIQVEGLKSGTITNINGTFSVDIPSSNSVIVVSYIGYISQKISANGKSDFIINLIEDNKNLDEVVVVGYGTKKKSLLTGATSSVTAADMTSSVLRAEQALQGKAAGVTVTPQSGAPGSGMKVKIRGAGSNGSSEPLYIVDGMRTGDINFLAPSDIESMEVLKDAASSAIYGAEGANGVVLIKTKAGKKGQAKIDLNIQFGTQSISKKPSMMNSKQYATFMTEGHAANFPGLPNPTTVDAIGTNWLDQIAENAPSQSHSLTISGGSDKGTYMVSAGYDKQDGVIGGKKASFERITTRVNLFQEVKPWLEVGANIAFTNSKKSSITEDDGFNGVINSALMMDPTTKPTYAPAQLTTYMKGLIAAGNTLLKDANGNYYGLSDNNFLQGELMNPLIRMAIDKGIYTDNKLLTSQYLNLKPFKNFVFTSRVGLDLAFGNYNSWTPSYYANSRSLNTAANVTSNDQKWSTWLWENFASYNYKIGENSITVMAGMSAEKFSYTNLNTNSGKMIKEDDLFRYPDYVDSRKNDIIGGRKEVKSKNSYFGRVSYDYKGKYMLEGTLRRDGSSLFGSKNKYGTFPSISGGWVASEESFWKMEKINFMKVRASWGQNGSLSNLGVDQYRSLITTTGIEYPNGNNVLIPGAEPDLLANAELRWETSEQIDLGLDLKAFNSRMYFTFDAYRKVTKDLLTPSTPALSHGNDAPYWNAGEVTNTGLEFMVGYQDHKSDFTYDVNVNLSLMKNEVTGMNSAVTRIGGSSLPTLGNLTYMELGQPIYYFRGYQNNGIFKDQAQIDAWKTANKITDATYKPVPGDPIVKNNVDDGTISDKDMANIGSPHPDMIIGSNITLGYKNFDLNIFMQGSFGQENFLGFARADNAETNKLTKFYNNRWTTSNTVASMPRAGYNGEYLYKSDLMVESGSYLKIRQIQLGYSIPKALAKKVLLSKARMFVSLNDYFTFSKYSGLDPEVGSQNNNAQGIDFGIYPVSKKVLFGLSLSF
jgi:TonB-dependent starch-binding outer membrane protein SusC